MSSAAFEELAHSFLLLCVLGFGTYESVTYWIVDLVNCMSSLGLSLPSIKWGQEGDRVS